MGTSSPYGGPSGGNPLLPEGFFDDNSDETDNASDSEVDPSAELVVDDSQEENDNIYTPNHWSSAKTSASNYASGRSNDYRKPVSNHVKAAGGGKAAAKSARAGKATVGSFANFLSGVTKSGIHQVLSDYKIAYEGRKVEDVLNDIVNIIAPVPATKEDAVARNAFLEVMGYLYENIEMNGGDIESLNNLTPETCNDIISKYLSSYIYNRFLKDLGSRFDNKAMNINDICKKEKDIRDYIEGKVNSSFGKYNGNNKVFDSQKIQREAGKIYKDCYEVIEDYINE